MSEFSDLWNFIVKRSRDQAMPVVQDYDEFEYVFNLVKGCEGYLEVGTAEGNSFYVMSSAIKGDLAYVDLGEAHTEKQRNFILDRLKDRNITAIHGDSNDTNTFQKVCDRQFDVVFIDAGHTYENALIDAHLYAPLARKYVLFHDIQMPDVNRAFERYCMLTGQRGTRVVNSENYGYGIIKCK